MQYGAKATVGAAGTGVLALTGFAVAGWLVAAITLILVGLALVQLGRRRPATRP